MTHWTRLALHVTSLGTDIEHGADVPGRVAVCEILRAGTRLDGVEVGAGPVDWSGLDAAIARLDELDMLGRVAPGRRWREVGDA